MDSTNNSHAKTSARESLDQRYQEYLQVVREDTFIDIARCTDPARTDQPWRDLAYISKQYGHPKVVQIWTKNAGGVLDRGQDLLESLKKNGSILLCQLTVTGFGPEIEPLVSWPVDWENIDRMITFLGTPQALLWRFDPIFPGLTDLDTLRYLAKNFAERGITRAVYNWGECGMELVQARMGNLVERIDSTLDMNALSRQIEQIGTEYGIDFSILAEGEKLDAQLNLASRGNWQYEWLTAIGEDFPSRAFMPGTNRPGCLCAHSFDVGTAGQFGDCHQCVYCFAP